LSGQTHNHLAADFLGITVRLAVCVCVSVWAAGCFLQVLVCVCLLGGGVCVCYVCLWGEGKLDP